MECEGCGGGGGEEEEVCDGVSWWRGGLFEGEKGGVVKS